MSNHMSHSHFLPTTTAIIGDAATGFNGASYADQSSATSSTSDAPLPSPTASGAKKRRSSKIKNAKQLSRSFSTPQIRDAAMSDSDADKKRNKLGYQRISIACAHCRRRKIRCVLADGDTQQRCQNCIRLKKDCVFYPVDQQAAMENRSESSGTLVPGSGPSSIVSSSPSNHGMDRPSDPTHEFSAFSSLPSNTSSSYDGLPLAPGSALPSQGTHRFAKPYAMTDADRRPRALVQPDHTFSAQNDPRSWSASAAIDAAGNRMLPGHTDEASQMFSQYANSSGMTGDYALFPTNEPMRVNKTTHNAQGFDYTQNSDGILWQHSQPVRSVSYGEIDILPGHHTLYQAEFRPHQRPHVSATEAQHPLPSLDIQNAAMMQGSRGPQSAPVGAHAVYGQTNPYMFQHHHDNANNASFPRTHTYPTGWYPDHNTYEPLGAEHMGYGNTESRPG